MNPAPNLVLVGPMGAGKSSIGRRLAARFGLPFVDVDREIEAQTGTTVATIFDCEGEAGFRARERTVLAALLAGAGAVIATGGGAVLDPATRTLLAQRGFVVYLQVGLEQQLERLARDRSRPLLAGADRREVLERLGRERGPLYAAVADLAFDTGSEASPDAAARLGRRLDGCWRRAPAEHPA
jgi:shikimate kinase